MVASREASDLAQSLIRETVQKQGISGNPLIIHSDRGPSLKSDNGRIIAALAPVRTIS